MKKYVECETFKEACINAGIFPVFIKNVMEKQSVEGHIVSETEFILSYDVNEPEKPYFCKNCGSRFKDYDGMNYCPSCGSKIIKVF